MAEKVTPIGTFTGHASDGQREPKVTARETRFVVAIAGGATLPVAAAAAGVSLRTGKRWHKRPEIAEGVRAELEESLRQARGILARGTTRAARSLVSLSDGAGVGDAPRVSASKAVLETAAKLLEGEDIERRIAEIEALLKGRP